MADWGSGYVTDTAYVHDFCRVQIPSILSFAALAKGIAAPGGQGEPLTYCDLGCGQGFTANLIAAANPRTEVSAIDFNPTHIASGRGLGSESDVSPIFIKSVPKARKSVLIWCSASSILWKSSPTLKNGLSSLDPANLIVTKSSASV